MPAVPILSHRLFLREVKSKVAGDSFAFICRCCHELHTHNPRGGRGNNLYFILMRCGNRHGLYLQTKMTIKDQKPLSMLASVEGRWSFVRKRELNGDIVARSSAII